MRPIYTILIAVALIVIGFYAYKLIPFSYTPNVPPLLGISEGELKAIEKELEKESLTEIEKQKLLARREEIYSLLARFFGKDIRDEMV